MATLIFHLVNFILSLGVSGVIIYLVTGLFGDKDHKLGTALKAALAGTLIYSASYFFLGGGFLSSFIGGVIWLAAIGSLYEIGWVKSFGIAFVVWFLASLIGIVLPTVVGPL